MPAARCNAWILAALLPTVATGVETHLPDRTSYHAPYANDAPIVDGRADDAVWAKAEWRPINNRWLGPEYTARDFSGRFKVAWTEERLYLLVEVTDDVLFDSHRDPLEQYWDDDCLEVFIDADRSGGDHQFNHQAFAYHFSLDNRAIDIGTDREPHDYTSHTQSRWRQTADHLIWEVAIDIYDAEFTDAGTHAPMTLIAGSEIGLMVAYCDNDGSPLRENFIGSETVPTGPKDRGWIDAGLFGTLILTE